MAKNHQRTEAPRVEVTRTVTTTTRIRVDLDDQQLEEALAQWARANVKGMTADGRITVDVDGGGRCPDASIVWEGVDENEG